MISKLATFLKTPIAIAAIALAAYLLVALWFKSLNPFHWLVQTETQLMPTLLELAETKEIEEIIAAEYYGEVLASLDEVRLRLEGEVPAAYDSLRQDLLNGRQARLNSFAHSGIYNILRKAGQNIENYIKANEFGKFERDHYKAYRNQLRNKKLVYLARGKVRVTYDLRYVIAQAKCEGANGTIVPLAECSVAPAKKLHLFLNDSLKQILASVNPFFVFKKEIVGFEVIAEKDVQQNFDLIREVRLLANHHLKETALRHGIVKRADESLRQTIEGFLRAVFATDIQVVIDSERYGQ